MCSSNELAQVKVTGMIWKPSPHKLGRRQVVPSGVKSLVFALFFGSRLPQFAVVRNARMASPVSSIPRKLSAVLWDIDGTLVNSTALAWTSTNTVLQENGFKVVSEDEYKEATRLTTPARLAFHATGDQNHEVGLKLAKEFDDHYVGLVSKATVPLVPGLQEVLETLEKDGLILGALSNACGAYVRAVLKAHNWSESFKTQLGADEVSEAKPGAGGLLKCCEVLRTDPSSTCYVGDSPGDGKAARAAGMFCVGVRWGGQAEEGLRSNFDEVVSTADELIAVLRR